ncbi:hypothetical protein EAI64_17095, partial [Escherichia coli]
PMTSLKTSIKTITYLSDIGCLEIHGASLLYTVILKGRKHSKVSKNAHLKLFACNLKAYLITNWNLMLLY